MLADSCLRGTSRVNTVRSVVAQYTPKFTSVHHILGVTLPLSVCELVYVGTYVTTAFNRHFYITGQSICTIDVSPTSATHISLNQSVWPKTQPISMYRHTLTLVLWGPPPCANERPRHRRSPYTI